MDGDQLRQILRDAGVALNESKSTMPPSQNLSQEEDAMLDGHPPNNGSAEKAAPEDKPNDAT